MQGDVKKLFVFKHLFTMTCNVFPLHLKKTFPPIIWISGESEGVGIESRLPIRIFFLQHYNRLLSLSNEQQWFCQKIWKSIDSLCNYKPRKYKLYITKLNLINKSCWFCYLCMEIWNTPLLMIDFKKEIASQHKRVRPAENMGSVGISPHLILA